ncbi:MAG TPA: hypothetical protein VF131_25225 [Blastocatellia bacterium]|nr:hypothetical protein [Blastocatellia bacterium]
MSPHDDFLNLVRSFGPYIPVLIVMVVGIIIAFARWKRHPKISLLTLLALGGQVILFVINITLNLYAGRVLFATWTSDQISTFYTVKYIISSLIEAGLWVLVLLAIFNERGEQRRPAQGGYGRPAAPTSA